MSESKSEKIVTLFEPSLLKRIDDFRFENRIGARAAVIRILIERGLEAFEADRKAENEKIGTTA